MAGAIATILGIQILLERGSRVTENDLDRSRSKFKSLLLHSERQKVHCNKWETRKLAGSRRLSAMISRKKR